MRVTSNSWGGARESYFPTALKNAIDAAGDAGILNVFAAGNAGANIDVTPFDPASFTSPSIVSVAASDSSDLRASWWNLYSRVYLAVVPGANVERAMNSFHSMQHALTLGWLGYLVWVRTMTRDFLQRGFLAAVTTAATGGYLVQP